MKKALTFVLLVSVFALMAPSPAQAASFPAESVFNAYKAQMDSQHPGMPDEEKRCYAAFFTAYHQAYVIDTNLGSSLLWMFQYGGWRTICPSAGQDSVGLYTGTTNPGSTNYGEGPGPYVAVSGGVRDAFTSNDKLYYVMAHELGHAWRFHFDPGYTDPHGHECWADDFAVALGANDWFGYCV